MEKARKLLATLLCLTLLIGLVACGKGEGNSLTGKWIRNGGVSYGFPDKMELFKDGTINCDDYSGTYTIEEDRLNISASIVSRTFSYSLSEGQLILRSDDGREASYNKESSVTKVKQNQYTNAVTMNIVRAQNFKNGYAFIRVGKSEKTERFAVIDKKGNLCFSFAPQENEYFLGNIGNQFYFSNIEKKETASQAFVRCLDSSGKEIYHINFATEAFGSIYFPPKIGEDGTILLGRIKSDYSSSNMQIALLDQSGKYQKDFFDITYNGERYTPDASGSALNGGDGLTYCGNGFAFLYSDHFHSSKCVLVNITEGKQFYISLDYPVCDAVSKYTDGYIYTQSTKSSSDSVRISTLTGKVETIDISIDPSTTGEGLASGNGSIYNLSSLKEVCNFENAIRCSKFNNGEASLVLKGKDNKRYVTIIDKNGKQKFEPIESMRAIKTDNNMFITVEYNKEHIANFYDTNGKELKSIDLNTFGNYTVESAISDGLILVKSQDTNCYNYITIDGKLLFPEGTIQIPVE